MAILDRGEDKTYFEVSGAGEPIVLVCGLSGDLQAWRFQVPELAKTHQVVTFDNRGAGRSTAPDTPYSIAQMSDDLAALVRHLGLEKIHLVGWSMGGVVAQTFALENSHLVKTLTLMATYAEPDGYLRAAIENWVNIRRSNMSYEQVMRYLARMVYSPALANKPKAYEAFIQSMVGNPFRQSEHGFIRQAEALLAYEEPDALSDLVMPTSVLVGESDQLTPLYLSQQLQAKLGNAGLTVLPGAHSGFVEYPEAWTDAIRKAVS
jgi:3-oxoadipate enol-lactonase